LITKSSARVDLAKNRVYLVMEGLHDLDEARRMRDAYAAAVAQCARGFTVLADVRDYRPGSDEVQAVHAEAVKIAARHGASRVARVTGETPLGGMQIQRIANTEHVTYASRAFKTLEEAESYLDAP
jgi:hypothetical protein